MYIALVQKSVIIIIQIMRSNDFQVTQFDLNSFLDDIVLYINNKCHCLQYNSSTINVWTVGKHKFWINLITITTRLFDLEVKMLLKLF